MDEMNLRLQALRRMHTLASIALDRALRTGSDGEFRAALAFKLSVTDQLCSALAYEEHRRAYVPRLRLCPEAGERP